MTYYHLNGTIKVVIIKHNITTRNERRSEDMNGYALLAESYRKAGEQGKIDKETAGKEVMKKWQERK